MKKIECFNGTPRTKSGLPIPVMARYRWGKFTVNCRIHDGLYFVTWHNGKQTARTWYSADKEAMNDIVRTYLKDGYKREL